MQILSSIADVKQALTSGQVTAAVFDDFSVNSFLSQQGGIFKVLDGHLPGGDRIGVGVGVVAIVLSFGLGMLWVGLRVSSNPTLSRFARGSSLITVLAVNELTSAANEAGVGTFRYFEAFVLAAAFSVIAAQLIQSVWRRSVHVCFRASKQLTWLETRSSSRGSPEVALHAPREERRRAFLSKVVPGAHAR